MTVDNINKTVIFFVDGKQVGEVHSYTNEIASSNRNLYIGQYSSNYRWNGGIDDVRFYKKVLNADEIYKLHKKGQSLVGYWKFDEKDGQEVSDSSNFSNHGTIIGAERIDGIMNGALGFDGVNAYVEAQNSDAYNGQEFTAAMWLKSENGNRTCAYMRHSGRWHTRTSNGQWDIVLNIKVMGAYFICH
ncbi:MAG: hypothetical protein HQK76_11430 [Desulfobacterales bacterium]|nr:hypothetical protein [Desulfobacterales bacterium]